MTMEKQNLINRVEVEHALNTILSDAKFSAAPQMSAFLRFVVMQTLEGNADRIKAYTVAVDALGKPATFDPQNDPSVRVLAKRLRDTLSQYYTRTDGHAVLVQLRIGSYVPSFVRAEDSMPEVRNVESIVQVMPIEKSAAQTTVATPAPPVSLVAKP